MKEVYPKFFIGNESDYEMQVSRESDWSVVHACKEPYHRQLLGYTGRGAPKDHPEYLLAEMRISDKTANHFGRKRPASRTNAVKSTQRSGAGCSMILAYS